MDKREWKEKEEPGFAVTAKSWLTSELRVQRLRIRGDGNGWQRREGRTIERVRTTVVKRKAKTNDRKLGRATKEEEG